MEQNQHLNSAFEEFNQQASNPSEQDEDLLDDEYHDQEIQRYIQQEKLDFLDTQSPNIPFRKQQLYELKQDNKDEVNSYTEAYNEPSESDVFEFDHYLNDQLHPQRDNFSPEHQQLDSERSNFTQESCSPPESERQDFNKMTQPYRQKLNIEDLTERLNGMVLGQKQMSMQDQNERSGNNSDPDEEIFALNIKQSPSKDSLTQIFQGQMTSNFPSNLRDSSFMKLREEQTNENQSQSQRDDRIMNDFSDEGTARMQQSESDSNTFNGSFYKFEGQKIKDFEKSTLIKFEEFEGSDSQQMEDSN